MINHPNFIGYVSMTDEAEGFLAEVRKVIKGTGFHLWLRGGNPNRKQFSEVHNHVALRRGLPLHLSTYARMYLRSNGENAPKELIRLVSEIRQRFSHTNLNQNVPVSCLK